MPALRIRGDPAVGKVFDGVLLDEDDGPVPVTATLVSERQLQINRDDHREVISRQGCNGTTTLYSTSGRLGAVARARRALIGRAAALGQELHGVLAKLDPADESRAAAPLKELLKWLDAGAPTG